MIEYDYNGNIVLVNAEDYKYTVIYCDADDFTHIIMRILIYLKFVS